METHYYKAGSIIFRTRESDEDYFIERLDNGNWIMDAELLKYLFDGEPGAEEISAAEAGA